MKNFTIVAGLVAALFISVPLHAEGPGNHENVERKMEKEKGRRMDHLTKNLNLTSQQQATVKAALEERHQQMVTLHKESAAKRKSINDSTNAKINSTLNEDQKKKFAEMQEKHGDKMEKRKEKRQERRGKRK